MENRTAAVVKRSPWPPLALFFLAPLVAEFLLGNLPIKFLGALVVLAPMYGGGALLIRELVRRTGRGWPSIIVLALAYGVVEEAFTTQTLFNPNYMHLNMHLLQAAWIQTLGIGGWWTAFVLTLHAAWSISTPIALIEATIPARATTPWLGKAGLAITSFLFLAGCVANTLIGYRQDRFLAPVGQLAGAGVVCVLLVVLALRLPRVEARASLLVARPYSRPSVWLAGGVALAAGSAVLLVPQTWGWGAAAAVLGVDIAMTALVVWWSRAPGWNLLHKTALGSGAALAYAWHAFIEKPVIGGSSLASVRIGNAVFALGAVALIALAARRTHAWLQQNRECGPLPN